MSQGVYLEETSYRLVEQLLFAVQDLTAKIDVLAQQTNNSPIMPCKNCGCGVGHISWCQTIGGSGKPSSSTAQ
jgi:hypothetical protein